MGECIKTGEVRVRKQNTIKTGKCHGTLLRAVALKDDEENKKCG
jgi:hypothetical protein